jgi:hypothetical protein
MYKAGTILLLVGGILHVIGAVGLVAFSALYFGLGSMFDDSAVMTVIGVVYVVLGLVAGVGAVFAFLAHGKATRGDAHGAWVNGLVAALLPPLQLVTLLGAIFCLVSPEGEAAKRARDAGRPAA